MQLGRQPSSRCLLPEAALQSSLELFPMQPICVACSGKQDARLTHALRGATVVDARAAKHTEDIEELAESR